MLGVWDSHLFKTRKAYLFLTDSMTSSPIHGWVWKNRCMLKHRVFLWVLNGKINTRGMMSRKNFRVEAVHCVLCNANVVEEWKHLFFQCHFSQECWNSIQIFWDTSIQVFHMLNRAKSQAGEKENLHVWAVGISGFKGITVFLKISLLIKTNGKDCC